MSSHDNILQLSVETKAVAYSSVQSNMMYVSRSVQNSLTEESDQDGTSMKLNTNIILEQ
jgi:hypothetical protein